MKDKSNSKEVFITDGKSYREIACEIEEILKKTLKQSRYKHTLGVANMAANLAMCYHADIDKAYLAGILHDCAKCFSDKKTFKKCKKYQVPVDSFEQSHPFILHGKLGSYIAREKYHITDSDILNAVCYHTTGRPNMSLLEKIIFLSDYLEPGRNQAPNLADLRYEVYHDMDACLVHVLSDTLKYLEESNAEIDLTTMETYNYYKEYYRNKEEKS